MTDVKAVEGNVTSDCNITANFRGWTAEWSKFALLGDSHIHRIRCLRNEARLSESVVLHRR